MEIQVSGVPPGNYDVELLRAVKHPPSEEHPDWDPSVELTLMIVGGPYDGLLLSTANCFARELAEVLELTAGKFDEATVLSNRIQRVVDACFHIVQEYPAANPFTNANKIMDQVFAYGANAINRPAPYLANGTQLPIEFIAKAAALLTENGFLPEIGYAAK